MAWVKCTNCTGRGTVYEMRVDEEKKQKLLCPFKPSNKPIEDIYYTVELTCPICKGKGWSWRD